MPHIEVLPNSTSANAPGWAYVPDTGYDPSKAAIVPSGARKRARNVPFATGGPRETLSARQQGRINKHLAELDKENHRDVQIVVPGRARDVGARGISGKMTGGVKKILLSQKTWANYLADEEAAIANGQLQQVDVQTPVALQRQASTKQAKTTTRSGRGSSINKHTIDPEAMTIEASPAVATSVTSDSKDPPETLIVQGQGQGSLEDAANDPFLSSPIPALPSQAEIEALLSAPPLTYNAARAGPTTSTAPARQFCEMCGYWGRARCMKCGVRVCGLECKTQHEETRCLKFYA